MRNNIADVLTFVRILSAVPLFFLILFDQWPVATVLFIVAIMSDALDGIAARRWPPKDRWYRKDPHEFDNLGDSLLFFAAMVGLTIKIYPLWLIVLVTSAVGSVIILILIAKMRPSIAELIDVVYGWCFGILLFAMLVQLTAEATEWWKVITYAYFVATAIIVVAKWDRATSRPEGVYNGTWLQERKQR